MGYNPEQVQDFYPTPSTLSTVMYYTGLDPRTMEKVYVPTDPHEKAMQRALIQYRNPKNYYLVREALIAAHREDLIGSGPKCLIRAVPPRPGKVTAPPPKLPAKSKKPAAKAPAKAPAKTPAKPAVKSAAKPTGKKPLAKGRTNRK
jgi:cell division septation protein DedD